MLNFETMSCHVDTYGHVKCASDMFKMSTWSSVVSVILSISTCHSMWQTSMLIVWLFTSRVRRVGGTSAMVARICFVSPTHPPPKQNKVTSELFQCMPGLQISIPNCISRSLHNFVYHGCFRCGQCWNQSVAPSVADHHSRASAPLRSPQWQLGHSFWCSIPGHSALDWMWCSMWSCRLHQNLLQSWFEPYQAHVLLPSQWFAGVRLVKPGHRYASLGLWSCDHGYASVGCASNSTLDLPFVPRAKRVRACFRISIHFRCISDSCFYFSFGIFHVKCERVFGEIPASAYVYICAHMHV